jgi:hypothetical protein
MTAVKTMTDNLENLATLLLLFLVVPLVILSIYAQFAARRSRAFHARERAEFQRRLQQPQFDDVERHYGRRLPEAFQRLHRDSQQVSRSDFVLSPPGSKPEDRAWHVASFLPADAKTLTDSWSELGKDNLPFACDEVGDPYYVPLDQATNLDGPVWQFHHDGGDREHVADSLADFLSWPAHPDASAGK